MHALFTSSSHTMHLRLWRDLGKYIGNWGKWTFCYTMPRGWITSVLWCYTRLGLILRNPMDESSNKWRFGWIQLFWELGRFLRLGRTVEDSRACHSRRHLAFCQHMPAEARKDYSMLCFLDECVEHLRCSPPFMTNGETRRGCDNHPLLAITATRKQLQDQVDALTKTLEILGAQMRVLEEKNEESSFIIVGLQRQCKKNQEIKRLKDERANITEETIRASKVQKVEPNSQLRHTNAK